MGKMGSRLSRNLIEMGYSLVVWDRKDEKMRVLENDGAKTAKSPKDVARQCDVIFTSVTDNNAVKDVALGENGIIRGISAGKLYIDLSTVTPDTSEMLAREFNRKGADFMDVKLSGSTPQVENRSLLILASGNKAQFRANEGLLKALGGRKVEYCGRIGMASHMKLAINTVLGAEIGALAEAIGLAESAGMPRDRVLDILSEGEVASPTIKAKIKEARNNDYKPRFSLGHMVKDLKYAVRDARGLNMDLPQAESDYEMYKRESDRVGDVDFSEIIRAFEEKRL